MNDTGVKKPFYIVALGASAGGYQALWDYFAHMPTHLPVAFVVILHLKADASSMADELLANYTALPVQWARDSETLQPHQIYLLPPGKYMVLQDGKFLLTNRDPANLINQAVDIFLHSLAEEWAGYCIGIILSGAGSDGTLGAIQVHAHGGIVMAQAPESALFASMPQWVIRRDHVQVVLPPDELASALVEVINQANEGPLKLLRSLFSQS